MSITIENEEKRMKKLLFFLAVVLCCIIAFSVFERYTENPDSSISELLTGETKPVQELTDIGSPYKFYYSNLDEQEKRAYNAILSEVYSMPESIRIPRIDSIQLDNVFWALLCDNPDLFFVGRCCTLTTSPLGTTCAVDYTIGKDEYESMKAQLEEVCDGVIASLKNPDDQWLTELEIHDYIINNCEYKMTKNDYLCSSAYGALVTKEAACEGYSRAAKLLLDRAGIESEVLCGISTDKDGSSGNHMWNAVKINGDYYYLDCTWDDPVSEKGEEVEFHTYFNVDGETLSKTHSEFSYDFGCTATAENYFVKTGGYFETYGRDEEEKLATIIAQELESGGNTVEVRFGSWNVYDAAAKDLISKGRIYSVLGKVKDKTDVDFSMRSFDYYNDSDFLTLTFVVKRK